MALYEKLKKVNIVEAVQAMGLNMDYDGRVKVPHRLDLGAPWIEQAVDVERDCFLWMWFFEQFKVIHPGCMSCWKIFYKPKTLRELYRVYDMQKTHMELKLVPSCKCGIETRHYTGCLGGYAAFWYNPLGCGLDKARKNLAVLREVTGLDLQLKRGCTEMEQFTIQHVGIDSTKWNDLEPVSKAKIEMLEQVFYYDQVCKYKRRPLPLTMQIESRWVGHAIAHGDMTYLDFTDGKKIPELHMYADSIDRERDIDDGRIWRDYLESKGSTSGSDRLDSGEKSAIISEL